MLPRSYYVLAMLLAGAALVVGTASAEAAENWRLGNPLQGEGRGDVDGPSISFTPRVTGLPEFDSTAMTLRYRPLTVDLGASTRDVQGFAIGGALNLEGVVVSARLIQESGDDVQRDEIDASVALGVTTAYGSYSEMEIGGGLASSRYALGADLATAPGISVGAGFAYEDKADPSQADDATGLVRFRLSF